MSGRPEKWYGRIVGSSPTFRKALVIDDNDFYANHLTNDLESRGAIVTRAETAKEGIEILLNEGECYDGLITDISMETELAGLRVLKAARQCRFSGKVATATTGLDYAWSFFLNRFFLGRMYHSDFLIPKRPIDEWGHVLWIAS